MSEKEVEPTEAERDGSKAEEDGSFEARIARELKLRAALLRGASEDTRFGTTATGQRFATLLTLNRAFLHYSVRVYMDEDHAELPNSRLHLRGSYLFKTSHKTKEQAQARVEAYHRQLKAGDYASFLLGLPNLPGCDDCLIREEPVVDLQYIFRTRDFSKARLVKTTPRDCAANPDKYLRRGDIVQIDFLKVTSHEGIYIGDGKVVHVSAHGDQAGLGKPASVAREGNLLGDFAQIASSIRVVVPRVRVRTNEEIASRAEDYRNRHFREGEYDLRARNCQHFTALCAFGIEYCRDLQRIDSGVRRLARVASSAIDRITSL